MPRTGAVSAPSSIAQPIAAGLLATLVGFAGSFPIVLQGLRGAGASPEQAASGLLALCVFQGTMGILVSLKTRQPVSIAWSTPGAALLITTGAPAGGYAVSAGAFLLAALLIVGAGAWKPFGRAVSSIPMTLASAMLAGVLFDLCLAPVRAMSKIPLLAVPLILIWIVASRLARLYAIPLTVLAATAMVLFVTKVPPGSIGSPWPAPVFVMPTLSWAAVASIALPLFIVTMASQNVPGLAVLRANGYQPNVSGMFLVTGLTSIPAILFGGHMINLAAVTAALCASPEADPDPRRRWVAGVSNGASYILFGLLTGLVAAFIAAAPPLLIQMVAGLALLGSLASSFAGAVSKEEERLPAMATFLTTASGIVFAGVGPAFWGLLAGGVLLAVSRFRNPGPRH